MLEMILCITGTEGELYNDKLSDVADRNKWVS